MREKKSRSALTVKVHVYNGRGLGRLNKYSVNGEIRLLLQAGLAIETVGH